MERTFALKDSSTVLIRHVRPDDGAAFQKGLKRVTASDIRNRFFSLIKELDPAYLRQLTNVDPEREIGLVAVDPDDQDELLAGGRLYIDPASHRAEYAAMVRSDLQGIGLGRVMLETLIEIGRQRGLLEIWGIVMSNNQAMLGLASRLGFPTDHRAITLSHDREGLEEASVCISHTTTSFGPARHRGHRRERSPSRRLRHHRPGNGLHNTQITS